MFGSNLRSLAQPYPSISELSRQLGINRTQFNRYLAGESFPRPDVLARICDFFDVDARVLLEPVEKIGRGSDPLIGEILGDFVGRGVAGISETDFPSGFYRFSRRGFLDGGKFVVGLVMVFRHGGHTYIRGYEARDAMTAQGLPVTRDRREFRGIVMKQEDGIVALISRKGSTTCSFNYLSPVPSFESNYWVGYVTRTVRDAPNSERVVRMVYEYLGQSKSAALAAARTAGYCSAGELLPYHQRLLQPEQPFR